MKVDFIRHAKSEANEKEIFSGSTETPLCEEGELATNKLAQAMEKHYSKYYSSTLTRARVTAEILFPGADIVIDDRLIERGLGQWEGKEKHEIKSLYPEAFLPSGKLHPLFTPPDGEPIATVATRLIDFLEQQMQKDIESMVAVTHNGIMRTARSIIENLSITDAFLASEKNLQIRSYNINHALIDLMKEKRDALTKSLKE